MIACRVIAVSVLLLCSATVLRAQQPANPLATARAKTELTDEDRNQIRSFITQGVGDIVGEDAAAAREGARKLREGFTGTDAFKQFYAAATVEVLGSATKKAELLPATRLLALLRTLNIPEARGVFVEALADERVGVRAAAAVGLRSLRPKIAASADVYNAVLNALKEAGKKEKSRETLRAIYGAMDFGELPAPPDLKPDAAALLELLEERARQYTPRRDVRALGADDAGLALAERLLKAITDDERKRLTIVVATLTKYALEEYCSSPKKLTDVRDSTGNPQLVEYRDSMERLVVMGERLLTALLSPKKAPNVLDGMRKLNKPEMRLQWNGWNELLKTAVNQDFTLVEAAEDEGTAPAPRPGGP